MSIFQWEMLMPWREVKPMDERVLFIGDYLRGNARSFSELCQRYGISRKTGYKWVERYKLCGIEGLNDQSRRPHSHPDAIPYACLLYTSPSPRDRTRSRMPSSA